MSLAMSYEDFEYTEVRPRPRSVPYLSPDEFELVEPPTSKVPTIPCPPPDDMEMKFDLDADWYDEED
jgi:hypothetical protein